MNTLEKFNFKGRTVRTELDGNLAVWFNAQDVAKALGYRNHRKAIADHCRQGGVTKRYALSSSGKQAMLFITESNVFRLVAHSHLPAAQAFESWVFEDVLPSLRQSGRYVISEQLETIEAERRRLLALESVFGCRTMPGVPSKANGRPRIQPRRATLCAPRSRFAVIDMDVLQMLLPFNRPNNED